jgi:hypothetical protein
MTVLTYECGCMFEIRLHLYQPDEPTVVNSIVSRVVTERKICDMHNRLAKEEFIDSEKELCEAKMRDLLNKLNEKHDLH